MSCLAFFPTALRRAALVIAAIAVLGGCTRDPASSTPDLFTDAEGAPDGALDNPQQHDSSPDYGLIPDTIVGDIAPSDAFSGDAPAPPATCHSAAPALVLHEIAVAQPDYVALKNVGKLPLDLKGYTLVLSGISPTAVFTVPSSVKLMPGDVAYVFEYSAGKRSTDINTGDNIPFYDGPPTALKPNAAALYAPDGALLDYVAILATVNLPPGATFIAIPWPTSFDSSTMSFQRVHLSGRCPNFAAKDWETGPLTRQ